MVRLMFRVVAINDALTKRMTFVRMDACVKSQAIGLAKVPASCLLTTILFGMTGSSPTRLQGSRCGR